MRTADELLRRLLDNFNSDGDLFVWTYAEGTALADVDPDLARDLAAWRAPSTPQPTDPAAPAA